MNADRDEQGLPPHSVPAEQGVLGCCLLDAAINVPKCLAKFNGPTNVFYDQRHQIIFETLVTLRKEEVPRDAMLMIVAERLRTRAMLEGVGGMPYLMQLTEAAPTAYNLDYWLPQLLDIHARRTLTDDIAEFQKSLADSTIPISTLARGLHKTTEYIIQTLNGEANRLSIRTPDEILSMKFDDSDRILGDRLLAEGQSLTILGPGGIGKSRLLLQLLVCSIVGREFLGLVTRSEGMRWLLLQTENSNRRLQFDLTHLKKWAGKKWNLVEEHLFIHTLETDTDGFLTLSNPRIADQIGQRISDTKTDGVAFDPLKDFAIGDLNSDNDMMATCQEISRLVKHGNPERAVIVNHHALTGKAGAAKATGYERAGYGRNSKMLQAWTRGQINVAPGSPENNPPLVLSCGKCSNGKEFERFAVKLNPETLIYEVDPKFDFSAWHSEVNGKKTSGPKVTDDLVRELCESAMSKKDLAFAIREAAKCGKSCAYDAIERAEHHKRIHFTKTTETYLRR